MSEGNGQGTREHLNNLKILLSQEEATPDLTLALAHCFVDVLEKIEKREKRQEEIDTVLFGNEKLGVKGLIKEIKPLLLFYRRFLTITAFIAVAFGAYKTGALDWIKKIFSE